MFAIIETGGKQYKVEEGNTIRVEKLNSDKDSKVIIDKVLMVVDGDKISVGKPYIKGATVATTKVTDDKNKKLVIYKFKRRKDYDKKKGHRQTVSVLKIDKINVK